MNSKSLVVGVVIVILCALAWNYYGSTLSASSLLSAPSPSAARPVKARAKTPIRKLTDDDLSSSENEVRPAEEIEAPPPPLKKCLDGSAKTITGRDRDGIQYRCASGAVGADLAR